VFFFENLKSAAELCLYISIEARRVLFYTLYIMWSLSMEELSEMLEHELENAVEVKDKNSLHRYVRLLVDNTIGRKRYESGIGELKSDVRLIAERIDQGFKRMDERFEAVDKRFEAVDRRFESMDKRFESLQTQMDKRFESMQVQMDRRFESMQIQMDKRFEDVNTRFDEMNGKFRMMFTFMTVGFTIVTTVTVLIRLLA
jgi:chaperonin cofactor prefoldin